MNAISVLNSTKNGDYIFVAAGLNNTIFYFLQIWKFPTENIEDSCSVHVSTILPGNTTCAKISAVNGTCQKGVMLDEDVADLLDFCVGSYDGSIDIFQLYVSGDKLSLFHNYHIKGNIGHITWTTTFNSIFISKSSISQRISESSERFIRCCSDSSRFVSRNSDSFKKNESEFTNSDLTEMMKKLSLQLSQSLRHMRSIAARHVLSNPMEYLFDPEFLKKLAKNERGEKPPAHEFFDYDIYFWNLRNYQCLRHLQQKERIDTKDLEKVISYQKQFEESLKSPEQINKQ